MLKAAGCEGSLTVEEEVPGALLESKNEKGSRQRRFPFSKSFPAFESARPVTLSEGVESKNGCLGRGLQHRPGIGGESGRAGLTSAQRGLAVQSRGRGPWFRILLEFLLQLFFCLGE